MNYVNYVKRSVGCRDTQHRCYEPCDISDQMASSAPHGLHAGYKNATLRLWQSVGTEVAPHNLMLPLFITDESPEAK